MTADNLLFKDFKMLKKHIKTFMAGAFIVLPLVATIGVIYWIGAKLGEIGSTLYQKLTETQVIPENGPISNESWKASLAGVLIVLLLIYFIGMLGNFWLFRNFFSLLDRMMSSVPGIKTVYESVRDLLKLFGSDHGQMGDVVIYTEPSTGVRKLGIVTNEKPAGLKPDDNSLAVYLPMAYMIGGPIIFARPEDVEKIDMSVETALKLAATAYVGTNPHPMKKLPKQQGAEKKTDASA